MEGKTKSSKADRSRAQERKMPSSSNNHNNSSSKLVLFRRNKGHLGMGQTEQDGEGEIGWWVSCKLV